jgi:N-acetylglutamate synthase-like GNAT family acetyltransferase
MSIVIKSPKTKDDFKAYYAVRYKVLREQWGLHKGTEKDDYEPISEHFMAVDEDTNEILGVVKLYERSPEVGCFSHLAVIKNRQRQGIGLILLDAVEQIARQKGYHKLGTMSRVTATAYFEKRGYRIAGMPNVHFGTIHVVWMEKDLG